MRIICPLTCKKCIHSEEPSGKVKTAEVKCKFTTSELNYTNLLEDGVWVCHDFVERSDDGTIKKEKKNSK